jgi:hypothetical protein
MWLFLKLFGLFLIFTLLSGISELKSSMGKPTILFETVFSTNVKNGQKLHNGKCCVTWIKFLGSTTDETLKQT